MALEHLPYHEACRRVRQYQVDFQPITARPRPRQAGALRLPLGTHRMTSRHKEYLRRRRFDPDALEARYGLLGTGPAGHLPHRLVIPIWHKGRMVSWTARDITGTAELRYISARPDAEEMPHRNTLYNLDNCRGRSVIVVEGITDCWRLGDHCCATFGTAVTKVQLGLLTEYSRVFMLFDGEPQAQLQASRICRQLVGLGVEAESVLLDGGDPGGMRQDEANKLKQELLKGGQNEQ